MDSGYGLPLTDDLQPEPIFYQLFIFFPEILLEKSPEQGNFGFRPLPVLLGEGKKGQVLDAEPGAGFDGILDRLGRGAMALDPRLVPPLGPAAVPVHDDGDVFGKDREVDLTKKRFFLAARGDKTLEIVRHQAIIGAPLQYVKILGV